MKRSLSLSGSGKTSRILERLRVYENNCLTAPRSSIFDCEENNGKNIIKKQMCPSQVLWQKKKKHGLSDIDFILPTDEDESLCVPRMGHVEPSARLHGAESSPNPLSTFTHAHTWGRGCEGDMDLEQLAGGADVQHKGTNHFPEGCLYLMCIKGPVRTLAAAWDVCSHMCTHVCKLTRSHQAVPEQRMDRSPQLQQ